MIGTRKLPVIATTAVLSTCLCAVPIASASAQAAPRSVVPIREVTVRPTGTPRYAVTLMINGRAILTGLDTGSIGLRILPRAVRQSNVVPGPQPVRYSYGSGVQLEGRLARAMVRIGATEGVVPLQAIDRVGCVAGRSCPAANVPQQAYGLMGSGIPGQGFQAIMGVRQMAGEVPNPLAALGIRRWIVHLPQRRGGIGALILNPTDPEVADFLPLRPGAGVAGTIGACAAILQPGARRICGPTLLDTGAPGLLFRGTPRPPLWQDGRPALLTLYPSSGGRQPGVRFRIGDKGNGGSSTFLHGQQGGLRLNAGTLPFYAYDVLFDRVRNIIAVRPNRSAGDAVHPTIH